MVRIAAILVFGLTGSTQAIHVRGGALDSTDKPKRADVSPKSKEAKEAKEAKDSKKPTAESRGVKAPEVITDRVELEKRLTETLNGAILKGSWRMSTGGDLGPSRDETYTIRTAKKEQGDQWVIGARMQFGEYDVTVPLRLRIVWAEDTPIVTITNLAIPGVGSYSARVMFYGEYYAGTWFGDCYGGVLSGRITHAEEGNSSDAKPKPGDAEKGAAGTPEVGTTSSGRHGSR